MDIIEEQIIEAIESVFEKYNENSKFIVENIGNGLYKLSIGNYCIICGKPMVTEIQTISKEDIEKIIRKSIIK